MKYQIKHLILTLILVLVFGLSLPARILAIGQLTKPIIIENGLRGQEIEQTLTILNTEDKEVTVGLLAENDIKDWTAFYDPGNKEEPILNIIAPANSTKEVLAVIKVPNDSPNGEYNGFLSIIQEADSEAISTTTMATVRQKVARTFKIVVTDQEDVNIKASIIPEKYDLLSSEPLKIRVIYDNQGNIAVKPQIQVKISQSDKIYTNLIFPYPEDEEAVKPLQRHETAAIEIPVDQLEFGKAQAQIAVLYNNKTLQEENITFSYKQKEENVEGTSSAPKEQAGYGIITIIKQIPLVYYLYGLLVIIIIYLIYITIALKKRS